jgi:ATP-dependent DNA helicase PIF1
VKSKKTILKRYLETECIIIDEISMVSSDFFDAFNDACKKLRANQAPFGGIQIVMTGDFFQLPPVPNSSMQQTCVTSSSQNCEEKQKIIEYPHYSAFLNHIYKETYDEIKHRGVTGKIKEDVKTKYLFHSKSWLDLFMNQMKIRELTETFRQIDPLFVSLLDDLRFGVHSKEMWSFLNQYKKKHHQWDNSVFEPTYLSPYRLATARYNTKKLIEIPGNVYSYESIDSVKLNEPVNSWVDVSSPFYLQHIFSSFSAHEYLNLKVGAQVILVRNLDVKNNLANGSRGVVIAFENLYDNLTNRTQMLPVVQFSSGNSYIVGYHDFQTRLDVDGITVQRKQIPLQLGWGMTIHRAQGVTLDKVIIDLPVSFAPGHAYVAFSRVKTLQGLSIERFGPKSLCASEKVKQFYTFFLTGRHQGNP